MFAPAHMATGALIQAGLQRKPETAVAAIVTHAIMDNPDLWHAPYPWPANTPAILQFLPYPHDIASGLFFTTLIVLTIAMPILLYRYWWGMSWALAPDVVDWVILRPLIGYAPFHDGLGPWFSTPWGFALEVLLIALVVVRLGSLHLK